MNKTIYAKCKTDKYANWIKDKIYKSQGYSVNMKGEIVSARFCDEDFDVITVDFKKEHKILEIIE